MVLSKEELQKDLSSVNLQIKALTCSMGLVASSPIDRESLQREKGKLETLLDYHRRGFMSGRLRLVAK